MGRPDNTLFLGVSLRLVLDMTRVWISCLSKVDGTLCVDRHHYFSLLRAGIEQNVEERGIHPFSLCVGWGIGLLLPLHQNLYHPHPVFSSLWKQTGTTLPVFLGLLLADSRSWDFLAFIICKPILYNKSPYIKYMYIYILSTVLFWKTLTHLSL